MTICELGRESGATTACNSDWFHAGCFGRLWLSGLGFVDCRVCSLWQRTVPLWQAERRDSFFLLACHVIVVIVVVIVINVQLLYLPSQTWHNLVMFPQLSVNGR